MISYLRGEVASVDSYSLVLDVGGVGYELLMSTKALACLPPKGSSCLVPTYMHVKDDGITLFGFKDQPEKQMFTRLIGVSGIGPKMAVAALSTYCAAELAGFIADGDVAAVCRVPGIGKKTAQRCILELQGVLSSDVSQQASLMDADNSAVADASQALQAMGFSAEEASSALKGLDASGLDASQLVRLALKGMGGR